MCCFEIYLRPSTDADRNGHSRVLGQGLAASSSVRVVWCCGSGVCSPSGDGERAPLRHHQTLDPHLISRPSHALPAGAAGWPRSQAFDRLSAHMLQWNVRLDSDPLRAASIQAAMVTDVTRTANATFA